LKEEGGAQGGSGVNWCCVGCRKDAGFDGATDEISAPSVVEGLE